MMWLARWRLRRQLEKSWWRNPVSTVPLVVAPVMCSMTTEDADRLFRERRAYLDAHPEVVESTAKAMRIIADARRTG